MKNISTIKKRISLGFPNSQKDWSTAKAVFNKHSLEIYGQPVMQDWESPYMERLADVACLNGGRVLELGFGMGISARFIQNLNITSHVIIEANWEVYKKLKEFSKKAKKITESHFGFWEEVCPNFASESFDGILFDTYPLRPEDIHRNHYAFFREANRLLKPDGVLTYYSDESDSYSDEHRMALLEAGFFNLSFDICKVTPPSGCLYWNSKTLMVPIVTKGGKKVE